MTTQEIIETLPLLIPLIVIEMGLQIYCLIDLKKRKKVRFGKKLPWAVLIIAFNILGSALYLSLRGEDEDAGD